MNQNLNDILLAFFVEFPQNKEFDYCLVNSTEKFEIKQEIDLKEKIYFFYIIRKIKIPTREKINISIKLKEEKIIESDDIEINQDEVLFQYSLFKKGYLSKDTKTFYKYHKFLKFIEEEKCSQEIINQFFLNTLEYLKTKKYINKKSSILISLILKVINNDNIFTEAINLFNELEKVEPFIEESQFSERIESLCKKKFERELQKKVDTFILYYLSTKNENKFLDYVKGKENLVVSNSIFNKLPEKFIASQIQNCEKEKDVEKMLSKCKSYYILFKILNENRQIVKDKISSKLDFSNYSFEITNEINDIIKNFFDIRDDFKSKIVFKKDFFIDFVNKYKKEEKGLELLRNMVRLIKELEKYSTDESSNLELNLNAAVSEILKKELDNIKYENKDLISLLKNDICSKNELKGRITFTFHQYLNLKTITEDEIKDYKDLNISDFYSKETSQKKMNDFYKDLDFPEISNLISIIDKNTLQNNKDYLISQYINFISEKDENKLKHNIENIGKIFKIFTENGLFQDLKKEFENQIKVKIKYIIFNYLLEQNINEESKNYISFYLLPNKSINKSNIDKILNIHNTSIIQDLLYEEYFSFDKIFDSNQDLSIIIFNKIKELKILEDPNYSKTSYIIKTKEIINNLKEKLTEFKINLKEMNKITELDEIEFKSRLNIFLSNEDSKVLGETIIEKINLFNKLIKDINNILEFLRDFFFFRRTKSI